MVKVFKDPEVETAANLSDLLLLLSAAMYFGGTADLTNGGSWFRAILTWIAGTVVFGFSVHYRNVSRARHRG